MFVLSNNEKKERFIITTVANPSFNFKQSSNINHSSTTMEKNTYTLQSPTIISTNGSRNNNESTLQGSIMAINHIPLKRRIRFHLSRESPNKENRKFKRQKEIQRKRKRGKEEVYSIGRWKHDEHQRFVEALLKYGNDWKQVQKTVRTRSSTQARSHAQKFFVKIQKAKILQFNLDLSKNSIKMLHDLVTGLSYDDQKKMMKALNVIAFERKISWKHKNDQKQSFDHNNASFLHNNNNHNEEDDTIPSNYHTAFHYHEEPTINDNEENYQEIINVAQMKKRKLSIEQDPLQLPVRKRILGSINSLEGFFNPYIEDHDARMLKKESFDEKDYVNSFNYAFKNEEGNSCWRKMSQDEDFLINYMTNVIIPGSDKK